MFFSFHSLALADDTTIGFANGSLFFKKDKDISLEKETLIISTSKINISYTYYNHSKHALTKTVAFPFPGKSYNGSIPTGQRPCFDKYVEKKPNSTCPFLDFLSKTNGITNTHYEIKYIAYDKSGKNITNILKKNKIPISSYFVNGIRDYDGTYTGGEVEKNKLLKDKLKKLKIENNWTTQVLMTWQEVFPPQSEVTVEESYTPSVGTALGNLCSHENKFCLQEAQNENLKKNCEEQKNDSKKISEIQTIEYVLKTGGNWKGGKIGHLHLEYVPNKSQNLGFCYPENMKFADGKYVGDFDNFIPSQDLKVTFIK